MSRLVSLTLLVAIISAAVGAVAVAEVKSKSRLVDTFLKLEIDANQFKAKKEAAEADEEPAPTKGLKYATFGNGCFWCTEAVFEELHGVKRVVSGYSGGHVANPTYEQVCSKRTGHAEVIHLSYDPKQTSYAKLLEVFWRTHDPTTLNRQGNDKGPQYRSVVFYHDEEQKELATHYKKKLNQAKAFGRPVVTEITEFEKFYPAEGYHQNYYKLNPNYGYCRMLIKPKLKKFRRVFADELAKNPKNRAPKSAKK